MERGTGATKASAVYVFLMDTIHSMACLNGSESITRATSSLVLDGSTIAFSTHGPVDVSCLEMTTTAFVFELDVLFEFTDLGGVKGESLHFLVLIIIQVGCKVDVESGMHPCAVEWFNLPLRRFKVGFSLFQVCSVFVRLVIFSCEVHKLFIFLRRFSSAGVAANFPGVKSYGAAKETALSSARVKSYHIIEIGFLLFIYRELDCGLNTFKGPKRRLKILKY